MCERERQHNVYTCPRCKHDMQKKVYHHTWVCYECNIRFALESTAPDFAGNATIADRLDIMRQVKQYTDTHAQARNGCAQPQKDAAPKTYRYCPPDKY